MSYSVLFFSILVVIFYCPLNKLLMTVVKHIFPCHGLNSHFCSKFPPSSHFCKMIICLHLFLQSGYHINWGQSCLLKAMNSGFFGGGCPQLCGIMTGFLQPDWPHRGKLQHAPMSYFYKFELPKLCVLDLYHWLVEGPNTFCLLDSSSLASELGEGPLVDSLLSYQYKILFPFVFIFTCLDSIIITVLLLFPIHSHWSLFSRNPCFQIFLLLVPWSWPFPLTLHITSCPSWFPRVPRFQHCFQCLHTRRIPTCHWSGFRHTQNGYFPCCLVCLEIHLPNWLNSVTWTSKLV